MHNYNKVEKIMEDIEVAIESLMSEVSEISLDDVYMHITYEESHLMNHIILFVAENTGYFVYKVIMGGKVFWHIN